MKNFKKLICILLVFALLPCSCLFASAVSAYSPGDVDGNGEIEAADARLALRFSLNLEQLDEKQVAAADVDGIAGIESSDARLILRAAVGLETLGGEAHEHEFLWVEDIFATCSEDGYSIYQCRCGETKKVPNETPRADHFYVDGVCANCGDKNGDKIIQQYKNFVLEHYYTRENGVYLVAYEDPVYNSTVGLGYAPDTDELELYFVAMLNEDFGYYLGISIEGPDNGYNAHSFVYDLYDANTMYYYGEFKVDVGPGVHTDYKRFDVYEGDAATRQDFATITDEALAELTFNLNNYLPDSLSLTKLGFYEDVFPE